MGTGHCLDQPLIGSTHFIITTNGDNYHWDTVVLLATLVSYRQTYNKSEIGLYRHINLDIIRRNG